jgi:hypothetical protein
MTRGLPFQPLICNASYIYISIYIKIYMGAAALRRGDFAGDAVNVMLLVLPGGKPQAPAFGGISRRRFY